MRIQFKTEGGFAYFPGLSKPRVIESEQLPKDQAAELEHLVRSADFFDLPTELGKPARGAADYQQYTVTVQEGRRRHTVCVTEPIEDPHVEALLTYLQRKTLGGAGTQSPPK